MGGTGVGKNKENARDFVLRNIFLRHISGVCFRVYADEDESVCVFFLRCSRLVMLKGSLNSFLGEVSKGSFSRGFQISSFRGVLEGCCRKILESLYSDGYVREVFVISLN